MPKLFYLSSTNSDLTGGQDFNYLLANIPATQTSRAITLASGATRINYGYTAANIPSIGGTSTGTFTVELTILSPANANITISIALRRVNSAGVEQAITAFSTGQTAGTLGTKTFTFTNPALGTWTSGDRLSVVYRFVNGAMSSQTVTFALDSTAADVSTPFYAENSVLYWVGGNGTWGDEDARNWASTSGGGAGISYPTTNTNIIFDNNSDSGTGFTVNVSSNAFCRDFTITNLDNNLNFNLGNPKIISGNLVINSTNIIEQNGSWLFLNRNPTSNIINSTYSFSNSITFSIDTNTNSSWTLQNNLIINDSLTIKDGSFDASIYGVTAKSVDISYPVGGSVLMGTGTWTLTGANTVWNASGRSNTAFNKQTSNFILSGDSNRKFIGNNFSYPKLTISGNNITNTAIYGSNFFDELTSTKTTSHSVCFERESTTNVANWTISGSSGNLVTIKTDEEFDFITTADPSTLPLISIAWDGTKFVAVGFNGSVIHSTDGINWRGILKSKLEFTYFGNRSIIWSSANNQFVMTGDWGRIFTSPDGTNWTSRSWTGQANTNVALYGVRNDNNLYIATGELGTILTSPDGINWTIRTSGTTNTLRYSAWSNTLSLYVVCGDGGTIRTSSDGITWSTQTSGTTNNLRSIVWADGRFVAGGTVGTIVTSTNGTNWTTSTTGQSTTIWCVSYGNGVYVATGAFLITSPTAASGTWTSRTTGTTNVITFTNWNGSVYTGVGDSGTKVNSTNGTTWSTSYDGVLGYLNGFAIGNVAGTITYVAVGDTGLIRSSTDGINWTTRSSGTTQNINGVIWISSLSLFIAIGNSGVIRTSPDGVVWTTRTSGTTTALNDIVFSGSLILVSGSAGITTRSTNGTTWTAVTAVSTTINLYGVTFGNNLYIMGGSQGAIYSSPNGTTWTTRVEPIVGSTKEAARIRWNGTIFCALGVNNYNRISYDGINWINYDNSFPKANGIPDAAAGAVSELIVVDDKFYAVSSAGGFFQSSDGINWTPLKHYTSNDIGGITYGENEILIGGGEGNWVSRVQLFTSGPRNQHFLTTQ